MEISDSELIQSLLDNLDDSVKCGSLLKAAGTPQGVGYFSNCLIAAMESTGLFRTEQLSAHVCTLAHSEFIQNFDIELFERSMANEEIFDVVERAMDSAEWRTSLISLAQQFADVQGMSRIIASAREYAKQLEDGQTGVTIAMSSDTPLPEFMFKLGEALTSFFLRADDPAACMPNQDAVLSLCRSQQETLSCILLLREMAAKYQTVAPLVNFVLSSVLLRALHASPNYSESALSFYLLKCGVPLSISGFYSILTLPSRSLVNYMYESLQASIALNSHVPGSLPSNHLRITPVLLFDRRSIDQYPLSTLHRMQREQLVAVFPHFDSVHPVPLEELRAYNGAHPRCTQFDSQYGSFKDIQQCLLSPSYFYASPSFMSAVATLVVHKSVRIPLSQKESISHGIQLLVLLHAVQHYQNAKSRTDNVWLHSITTGARRCLSITTELITHIQSGQSFFIGSTPQQFLHTYGALLHISPVQELQFTWICTFLVDSDHQIYPAPTYNEYQPCMVLLMNKIISVDSTKRATGLSVLYNVYKTTQTQAAFLADALVSAAQAAPFPTSSVRVLATVPVAEHPLIALAQWILNDSETPQLFSLLTKVLKLVVDSSVIPAHIALIVVQYFQSSSKYTVQKPSIMQLVEGKVDMTDHDDDDIDQFDD